MTKAQWLRCEDPVAMLKFLRGRVSNRKYRLLACACCRRLWPALVDDRSRNAVRVAEQFADGEVGVAALTDARLAAHDAAQAARGVVEGIAMKAAWDAARNSARHGAWSAVQCTGGHNRGDWWEGEPGVLAPILRELFNPYHPGFVPPAWLTWNGSTVPTLARAVYDDHHFTNLPILADALEDAGCTDDALLEHCRGGGDHVRGCWVVDLLLDQH